MKNDDLRFDEVDFKRELTILSLVKHPNIIEYFGFWEEELNGTDEVYLVMRVAELGNLQNYIPNKSIVIKKYIIREAGIGLEYIHSLKILHRDLSPDNILICLDKTKPNEIAVKISDFGTSKILSKKNETKTKVIGKPKYIAPEIVSCFELGTKIIYNQSSDVFSFGMIMAFVALEKHPFENEFIQFSQFSEVGTLMKIYKDKTTFPTKYLKEIKDPEISNWVKLCWNLNEKQRPTFSELFK